MTTTSTQEPQAAAAGGRAGFVGLLRAEWTKLWSVYRWLRSVAVIAALTVGFSVFMAAGSSSNVYEESTAIVAGPDGLMPVMDQLRFVHQPLAGDGSVSARVRAQDDSHPLAMAGVMVKQHVEPGAPYVALFVTPDHGVRLQSNFTHEVAGAAAGVPRWLRLTRAGTTVTGYSSADGSTWRRVGGVELPTLPSTVAVGLFVTSPYEHTVERLSAFVEVESAASTIGTATFDRVGVAPAAQARPLARWQSTPLGDPPDPGETTLADGAITVSGSGGIGVSPEGTDIVPLSLAGVFLGMVAAAVLGVQFITAEYAHGTILTTFTSAPRRAQVLAAKAAVLGGVTFIVGVTASAVAFLAAQPQARASGFALPGAPPASLADGPVLRAVVGSGLLIALAALLGLGVGALLRRTGWAVTATVVVLVAPSIVANFVPSSVAPRIRALTPQIDLTVQHSYQHPGAVVGPWAGVVAVAAWAAVALLLAALLLHRRDA